MAGLVARQQIDKLLRRAAEKVGIDATRLGTHVGRRTVVTALYTAGTDIGDIARPVGRASQATTSRYVASVGERPLKTARLAAELLDTPMTDAACRLPNLPAGGHLGLPSDGHDRPSPIAGADGLVGEERRLEDGRTALDGVVSGAEVGHRATNNWAREDRLRGWPGRLSAA